MGRAASLSCLGHAPPGFVALAAPAAPRGHGQPGAVEGIQLSRGAAGAGQGPFIGQQGQHGASTAGDRLSIKGRAVLPQEVGTHGKCCRAAASISGMAGEELGRAQAQLLLQPGQQPLLGLALPVALSNVGCSGPGTPSASCSSSPRASAAVCCRSAGSLQLMYLIALALPSCRRRSNSAGVSQNAADRASLPTAAQDGR